MVSPTTLFLKELSTNLKKLNIPVYFKLPEPSVPEPFFVIGTHTGDDTMTAKTGVLINDINIQIDLYYPSNSRTEVEEVIHNTKINLGRRRQVTSRILIDNSIGREVYHVVFNLRDTII